MPWVEEGSLCTRACACCTHFSQNFPFGPKVLVDPHTPFSIRQKAFGAFMEPRATQTHKNPKHLSYHDRNFHKQSSILVCFSNTFRARRLISLPSTSLAPFDTSRFFCTTASANPVRSSFIITLKNKSAFVMLHFPNFTNMISVSLCALCVAMYPTLANSQLSGPRAPIQKCGHLKHQSINSR